MGSFAEIIIIVVIVVIVFGVGKVSKIGTQFGRAKKEFKKGLEGEEEGSKAEGRDVIDITPDAEDDPSYDPKPGTRLDPVEDAEIESSA